MQQKGDQVSGIYTYTYGDVLLNILATSIGRIAKKSGYYCNRVDSAIVLLQSRATLAPFMYATGFPAAWARVPGKNACGWHDHTLAVWAEERIYCLAAQADLRRYLLHLEFRVCNCVH
jgi:hypothetical protein